MAEITAQLVKAAPRAHRRRNDGMQERAGGSQGRPGGSRSRAAQARHRHRRPRRPRRATKQGVVGSYIHAGAQLGVLVEVNCESDFVARTDDFQQLVHDIAMQIAAADPQFIRKEDVTAGSARARRARSSARARWPRASPRRSSDKIVEGRMSKFYEEVCLSSSPSSRTTRSPSAS